MVDRGAATPLPDPVAPEVAALRERVAPVVAALRERVAPEVAAQVAALRERVAQPTGKPCTQQAVTVGMEGVSARVPSRASLKRSPFRELGRHVRGRRDGDTNMRRLSGSMNAWNPRSRCSPDYDPDYEMSYIDSFEHSPSSSDKENTVSRRRRLLDDVLFEFFRGEAVKTLKRNFSNFCGGADMLGKTKRLKGNLIGRDDFVSYSVKYFWDVINSMSIRRKDVVREFGFGCLLLCEKSEIPSEFIRWLASCVDPVSSQIIVDDCKILAISKDFVHRVIGLQNSGSVPLPDSEGGAKFLMSMFGFTELPHITFFGNKLKSKEVLTDKEVFVCFMVVAFKCFLFPSADEYVNTDFLHILVNPESASGFDLCMLVYEHLIAGVVKFSRACKLNGRKPKQFEFCYYALAVYYLDALDFGARMLDQSVPRITVWKGHLIKYFSNLDLKKKNRFGKRQLKKNLAHCYSEFGMIGDCKSGNEAAAANHPTCFTVGFKQSLNMMFGSKLEDKIINGIVNSVESVQVENFCDPQKLEIVVTNVLSFLISLNLFDAKVPAAPINALARDTCNSENLKSESDVASKLDLISPGLFSKGLYSIKNGMTNLNTYGTPEHAIPNAAELSVFKTAPIMQPMHKIKSRLPNLVAEEQGLPLLSTYPSGVKSSRSILFMSSPVSRINFSPSANVKVPQEVLTVPNNHAGSKINSAGCKLVPIEVLDATPKPELARASPDVLITGASSFTIRQAELAKKGDELYNNMSTNVSKQEKGQSVGNLDDRKSDQNYIDLSQHAVEERLPKDELVILQPKNSLVLPLVQNGRFPVSSADVNHYCAIVDIAYTKGIQKFYAVKYMKVHCSYISLGQSLMVEGHVDNFLIPVFCRKLFEDNHPSKSGRHHFFSFVGESILAYESDVHFAFVEKALLGAATASKGKRLELSDRLFFPICRIRHWFTFCVDFKYKVFIFLDSIQQG